MGKQTATAPAGGAELTASSLGAGSEQVFSIILNPAPIVYGEEPESGSPTRDNTPWYYHFPVLGITVQATDPDTEEPVTGFYSDKQAQLDAANVYRKLMELSQAQLNKLREANQFPVMLPNFKLMPRLIYV